MFIDHPNQALSRLWPWMLAEDKVALSFPFPSFEPKINSFIKCCSSNDTYQTARAGFICAFDASATSSTW